MKLIIYIRPGSKPSTVTMRTDIVRESKDTPRISNFGLEIKGSIDEIIRGCEEAGKVHV